MNSPRSTPKDLIEGILQDVMDTGDTLLALADLFQRAAENEFDNGMAAILLATEHRLGHCVEAISELMGNLSGGAA